MIPGATRGRRFRGDAGFTLPELVISTVIMGVIFAAVGAALLVGLRSQERPEQTLMPSNDANLLSRYFSADVQSAAASDIAPSAPSGCDYATPAGTRNVLALSWLDNAPETPVRHAVAYHLDAEARTITRVACVDNGTPKLSVLARDVHRAAARIDTGSGGISLDVSSGPVSPTTNPGAGTDTPAAGTDTAAAVETTPPLFSFTLRAYGRLAGGDAGGLGPGAARLPGGEVAGTVTRYDDVAGTVNPAPVAGVTLSLTNEDTDVITTTGNNGRFYFGTLDDGQYLLSLTTPSYLPTAPQETLSVPVSVDSTDPGPGTAGGGRDTATADLSVLQAGTLSGAVRTDRYVMLGGVRIELTGPVSAETVTDENGQYRFGELPTGSYNVEVVHPDGYVAVTGQTCSLAVAGDDPRCPDAVYRYRMAAITGIVRTDTDQALAGAAVTLSGATTRTVTTDSAGRYRFGDLLDGSYTVTVSPPPGFGAVQGAICTRQLAGADATCPDAVMQRAATSITGIVLRDLDLDGVGDVPIKDAYVKLYQNGNKLKWLYTGPDGLFRFDDVNPGSYVVWHYTQGSGLTPLSPSTSGQVTVNVVPGQAIAPITYVDRKPCSVVPGLSAGAVRLEPSGLPAAGQALTVAMDARCWEPVRFSFDGTKPGPIEPITLEATELNTGDPTTATTSSPSGARVFTYRATVSPNTPTWVTGDAILRVDEPSRPAGKTTVKVFT
ncbi:MAG: carboxypeptidase regulatory-like domain-containing protein [Acidimicrobiales bacterium]|nr:carboxypeptidase regulatory-like domain-containing protein [Acidimicrobiales bacterium]